jgi:DNA-binding MarR family transcriptional regulator
MRAVTLQKLKKEEEDSFSLAEKYYSLLSAINDMKLTTREIQLIAYAAVRGNMSYANIRKDFCERYGTTNPSINNIVSRLKRIGILVKDASKVKVNPMILLNFENDVTLEVKLIHGQTK